MDWLDEVRIRLKKKNQILFVKDIEYLQNLTMLFREQSHRLFDVRPQRDRIPAWH